MASLKYPTSTTTTGLYLQFAAYDYSVGQANSIKSIRDQVAGDLNIGGISFDLGLFGGDPPPSSGTISGSQTGVSGSSGTNPANNTSKGSVFLYLPTKLDYSYGASWNKVSFGALGSAFTDAAIDLGAAAKLAGATGANAVVDNILKNEAFKAMPKVEGLSLDTVLGASFGVTFNDNTLQTFDRMDTRSFSFDYLMVARNAEEENEIKKIIKFFKLAMHPSSKVKGRNNSLFLDYPYIFKIFPSGYKNQVKTKKGQNIETGGNTAKKLIKFLPATQFCALNKVTVDYAPDNIVALTKNDFVTAVRMSLSFSEIVPLTRQDINTWEDSTDFSI